MEILGPVRHRCVACGGGCFGTDVLIADDEREAIAARAAELGVAEPFDGAVLRKEADGRCVFLDEARKCRLHAAYGIEAKPAVCRQYPYVARQVGVDIRLGVDPGCLHAWESWEDGPEIPDGTPLYRSRGGQPMAWNREERALVALLDPDRRRFADVLGLVSDDGLPGRIVRRLQDARIAARIAHPGTARSLRESLRAVCAVLPTLDPDRLPPVRVPDALDRWTVETLRRLVWLRLPAHARPTARLLGGIAGGLVCGWAHDDVPGYGVALAAWTRVFRTSARALTWPDDDAVRRTLRPEEVD